MTEPPSLMAQLAELLGRDPDGTDVDAALPTVEVAAADLRPGTVTAAVAAGQRVCVARLASGRLAVLPDRCPHDGGRISDGWIEDDFVVCARHGWRIACDAPCPPSDHAPAPPAPPDDPTRR
jgi:hypothetical protein